MTLWALLVFALIGAVAGYLARLLVPGRDPMGCLGTTVLGMAGSFVGGTLASLLFDEELDLTTAGFVGSLLGAIVILLLLRGLRR